MADSTDKWPENVPGAWYVDGQCIYCGLCVECAPGNFAERTPGGWAYVTRQPRTEEELRGCQEALEGCPSDSIGRDGIVKSIN
jgi:ferredoxin